MKLHIKTLSPLHIGNGEKYNSLAYLEDIGAKKVYIVDFEKIEGILNTKEMESFMNWVTSTEYPSLYNFIKDILKRAGLMNEFKKVAIYSLNNYSTVRNLRDIECFIKQNNKPYIPGTEIKGAIRTAIAYHLLNKNISHYLWLKDKLLKLQSKYKNAFLVLATCNKRGNDFLSIAELKTISQIEYKRLFGEKGANEIINKLSQGIDPKRKVNAIKKALLKEAKDIEKDLQNRLFRANGKADAKYDLLKFLHLPDSDLKSPSECLFVSDLKTLNISRSPNIFQELCKKDQTFTCQGLKLENNQIVLDKLGFDDDQKWIISDIKNILQCCYEFTNRLLDEEIAYPYYPPKVKDKLKTIKGQNKPESPVIRVGKNEGYLSVTVGLIIKDRDKTLYDNVLCHATKNTSYTGNFPKTRRIVNLANGDVDTCGWVKLNI